VLRGGRRAEDASDFRLVDLDRPETVAMACADADIVISAVEDPRCRAERHVLQGGGTILNMATIKLPDRERLRASVADPRGRVIFGAGYSGLTAVATKDLLARHPEADSIESAYSLSIKGMSGGEGALFGHRLIAGGSRRPTREIDFPRRGERGDVGIHIGEILPHAPRVTHDADARQQPRTTDRLACARSSYPLCGDSHVAILVRSAAHEFR
jgi:hypothetical protein